jgi:hypothetical protein
MPIATSYYGPRDEDLPPREQGESERQWRVRIRFEAPKKVRVWERSPSPPQARKGISTSIKIQGDENSKRSVVEGKSNHKEKKEKSQPVSRRRRRRSPSSESSSSSSSSSSTSSSSSSEDDRKSRRSKENHGKRNRSPSPEETPRQKKKKHNKLKSKSESNSSKGKLKDGLAEKSDGIDKTMEKPAQACLNAYELEEALHFKKEVQGNKVGFSGTSAGVDDSDDDFGPKPLPQVSELDAGKKVSYGSALLPGEGAAIAQFVQQNMRIPRRGEIGWQAEEIESLEDQGYVMSGSRHKRMNAVRLRKENQVYSAEEKRALALITMEERQQKENKIIGDFRSMLTQRLKSNDNNAGSGSDGNVSA